MFLQLREPPKMVKQKPCVWKKWSFSVCTNSVKSELKNLANHFVYNMHIIYIYIMLLNSVYVCVCVWVWECVCVWCVYMCVKQPPRSVVSSYLTIVRLIKRAPAAITASAGVRARSRAAALL